MATRSNLRGNIVRASSDWLADEHAQRDLEREPAPLHLRAPVRSYPRTRSLDGRTFVLRTAVRK